MTRYLTFEDILRQVERLGFVVRDPGLLASAIGRPATSTPADPRSASADLAASPE